MSDQIRALVEAGILTTTAFAPSSRYYGLPTAKMESANGHVIVYLRRRLVPQPERFSLRQEHMVKEGDRLDNIAAHYLGDPEQFWVLCDANGAMRPNELTDALGARIRITLPEGIPGAEP